jgi:hypothetical protein
MYSWLLKQSKRVESDSEEFDATSSTVDGSPAERKEG